MISPGFLPGFSFICCSQKNLMTSKQIQTTAMSKGWNIMEKIIALLLAIGSLLVLYNQVSIVSGMLSSAYVVKNGATFFQIFKTHHLALIVSILGLFGGFMMIFNDKRGWLMCLISLAMFGILFYMSSRSNATDKNLAFASFYKSYGITAIICFVLFIVLLWSPFRKKYNPVLKNWLWLGGILLVLLVDKLLI